MHVVLVHVLAADSTTDCSADDDHDQKSGDHEECADFHAENDSWGSVVAVESVNICRFIGPRMDDRIFVGRRGVDRVIVFETVCGCDFGGVVVLV